MQEGERLPLAASWRPAIAFVLLAGIAVLLVVAFFASLERQRREEEEQQLATLARLKAEQIEQWLRERRRDGEALAADPVLLAAVRAFVARPDLAAANRLKQIIEASRAMDNARGIELVDAGGRPLLAAGRSLRTGSESELSLQSASAFIDLPAGTAPGGSHFSFLLPLGGGATTLPPGIGLRLAIGIDGQLSELLRAWPRSGTSGETLLVRREGDALVCLSQARHPAGEVPPPRRVPSPGAALLDGDAGPHGNYDYRGVKVLAALHPVAGTRWLILAKVDEDEALAAIAGLRTTGLAVAATALLFAALLWRQAWRHQAGRAERALRTQLDDIAASLPGALCCYLRQPDGSARFPYASPAFERLYGLSPATLATDAAPLFARIDPEDAERLEQSIRRSETELTQWHAEFRYQHPERGQIWIEGRSSPHRQEDGSTLWHGYVHEVTERRRSEEVLEQARARYRGLLDNIPGAAFRCETQGPARVAFVSDGVEAITGHPAAAFLGPQGLRWSDIAFADDLPVIRRAVADAIAGSGAYQVEYRVCRNDGRIRWVFEKGRAIYAPGGRAEWIDGVIIDITARVEAEAAVKASSERWRRLAEAMPQLVWSCGADGCCDYVNQRWLDHTGLSADDSRRRAWLAVVHPEEQLQVALAWRQATERGSAFEAECRLRGRDGGYRWFKSSALPVADADGDGLKWYGSSTDIEDIKEFEAALQRSLLRQQGLHQLDRAVLEASTPEEVAAKGLAHLASLLPFEHGNARAIDFAAHNTRLLAVHDRGCDFSPAPTCSLDDFGHRDLKLLQTGRVCVVHDLAMLGERPPVLEQIWRAGLRSCLRVPLLNEGRLVGSLNLAAAPAAFFGHQEIEIVRPVADVLAIALQQAFLRQHLARQASLLEMRVAERTAELALMKDRAEAANLAKSRFLARMAHELRIPLNSLLILSQMLADNTEANLTAEQVGFARVIHDAGGDLLGLINDILDLSKIESGRAVVAPRELPFAELLAYLEGLFEPQARNKGLRLELACLPALPDSLRSDPDHLKPVLRNLVANAIKFTPAGSVRIEAGPADSGWRPDHPILSQAAAVVAFRVSDTGVGIPSDKLPLIFEIFEQAAPETGQRFGGTGLGLHIARTNAALLGGELTVRSRPGTGSTFTLYLPLEHMGPAPLLPPG